MHPFNNSPLVSLQDCLARPHPPRLPLLPPPDQRRTQVPPPVRPDPRPWPHPARLLDAGVRRREPRLPQPRQGRVVVPAPEHHRRDRDGPLRAQVPLDAERIRARPEGARDHADRRVLQP